VAELCLQKENYLGRNYYVVFKKKSIKENIILKKDFV